VITWKFGTTCDPLRGGARGTEYDVFAIADYRPQPICIRVTVNMEELRNSLDQTRLRCLLLEADKHAEIAAKDVEKLRASRYRCILAELAGEGERADVANRPQASGLHLMPWNGSANSTSPAVRHI
jgi:hypothetical protein